MKLKKNISLLVFLVPMFLIAQNILVTDKQGSCEPSIKIDPMDPDRMVAGIVLDHVAFSEDGGHTWTLDNIGSTHGVWGDPVIEADFKGAFYYFHLSNPNEGHWIDRIVAQRSDDGGRTWNNGSFTGLNGTKQQDKHWTVVDPATGIIYVTWTEFDTYGSKSDTCFSRIRFSSSVDQGKSWTEAITISEKEGDCIDDDETTEGAVPAVGPRSELYVCWANREGLAFSSSMDGGKTWSPERIIDPMPGGWAMDIPGIYRANGMPILKVDLSHGPEHGTLYLNWADQRNGENDTDIWLMLSKDKGETWSAPIRVNNDPPGRQQFFTWMDVDQSNGKLYLVFYDRRAHDDDYTDVYLATVEPGGQHIKNQRISDEPFLPTDKIFFGDYTNISVVDGHIRPIWTRMDAGETSVWTDISEDRMNPMMLELSIPFTLDKSTNLCLWVKGPDGKIKKLFKKKFSAGTQQVVYLMDCTEKERGTYSFVLMSGKKKKIWTEERSW